MSYKIGHRVRVTSFIDEFGHKYLGMIGRVVSYNEGQSLVNTVEFDNGLKDAFADSELSLIDNNEWYD